MLGCTALAEQEDRATLKHQCEGESWNKMQTTHLYLTNIVLMCK